MNFITRKPIIFLSLIADNSDIVCADACKDTIYVLATNNGIESPEDFGALVCNHLISEYSHMTKVRLTIDDFTWNRIAYDSEMASDKNVKLHNHAFIHSPECVRTCSVTLNRKGSKSFTQAEFQFKVDTKSFMFD